jgi:hypothetical protein
MPTNNRYRDLSVPNHERPLIGSAARWSPAREFSMDALEAWGANALEHLEDQYQGFITVVSRRRHRCEMSRLP